MINDVFIAKTDTVIGEESSQQILEKVWDGLNVIRPRIAFDTLADFMDMNVWHARCVELKAGVTVGLGWKIVSDDPDKQQDDEYRRLEAFLNEPNLIMSFDELALRVAIDYYNIGNGFVEIARSGEKLVNIFHAPGRTMRRDKNLDAFWQVRNERKAFFWEFGKKLHDGHDHAGQDGANEMMQCMRYDPKSDYYGQPDWVSAMASMVMDRAALSYNTNMFNNEMLAKMAMVIEGGELAPAAQKKIEDFFRVAFKGVDNAGKLLIIPTGDPNVKVHFDKLQADEKDLAFMKGRAMNRDEVIAAHGVPPRLVGVMTSGQLGGSGEVEGQMRIFKEVVIDPEKKRMESFFNRIFKAGLQTTKWRLSFNEIDVTGNQDDADYLTKVGPYLTDDEARALLGYEPRERQPAAGGTTGDGANLVKALVGLRKRLEDGV